jgi:hypothetical protein
MAITDAQKVDLLYKKIGFGVAKTDTSAFKSPSNEANASPLLTRGDTIWVESSLIPATKPVSNSSVMLLYQDTLSSTIQATLDSTVSGTNRTWLTNLRDWIPAEFGSDYQVKVYADTNGSTTPQTTGTQLFADGSGNSDSWYFDYQAGILNFPDTNVPTAVSGKRIFVVGARYAGLKGIGTLANLDIGNLNVNSMSINNASILGGYLSNIANITALTSNIGSLYSAILNVTSANVQTGWVGNLSTGNAVISGGYISSLSNATITTGNTQSWYTTTLNSTSGNITTLAASNFSTANALVAGGIIYNTDIQANNFSTANALITGGVLNNINIQANNFSTANALITGGNITANITGNVSGTFGDFSGNVNADWFIGNVDGLIGNFSNINVNSNLTVAGNLIALGNILSQQITSPVGDLHISAATNDPNNIIRFDSVSAFDIPSGTTAQRPPNPDYGYVRYNTDQGSIEWWTGAAWIQGAQTITSEVITADGINDTFTLNQSTTEDAILVNINGTIQQAASGAYSVAGNQITFAEIPLTTDIIEIRYIAGGVAAATIDFENIASNVIPSANITYDLGSSTNRWRDLWLSGNTINIGAGTISAANGNITITNPQGGSFRVSGSESGNATATFGNVYSKAFYFANGTPFTSSTFGNVEVAAYLLANPQGNFYSNANVTAYIPTDATILAMQANITAANLWIANAASQAQELITLTSNAAAQADSLTSLLGNAAIQEANLAVLVSNAASQQSGLDIINANIGAYQTYANANVVAIQANLGAYQTYANANAASQSTEITALRARAFTSVMVFGG